MSSPPISQHSFHHYPHYPHYHHYQLYRLWILLRNWNLLMRATWMDFLGISWTLIHGVTLHLLYVAIGYMFVCIIYWVYYILLDIDTHCCWIYRFCDRPLGGQITQRASQLQSMGRNLAKRIPSDCSECPIANCRREYSRCSTGIFPYNASAPCRSHAEHIC